MLKKFLITIALGIFVSPAFAGDPEGGACELAEGEFDEVCVHSDSVCNYDRECESQGYYLGCDTIAYKCICGECSGGGLVHCDPNTYWNGSTCVTCPAWGTVSGKSTGGDQAPAITGCYIQANSATSFSDSTGSGNQKFTSNCYYSN